jgi:hypothetical protein
MDEAAPQAAAVRTAEDDALEALRLDWQDDYLISHDDEYGWRAARLDGLGDWLAAGSPGTLRKIIASDYEMKPVRRLWCEVCGKRAAILGHGPGSTVHRGTALRDGPDGHNARPVDAEPPLWEAARRITADYGGAFILTAPFGFLRADQAAPAAGPARTAVHYEAPNEAEMRRQLDEAIARTRWARGGTGR